jgi:ABC-type Mn2+/Zn2+ transport system ATPase subunit
MFMLTLSGITKATAQDPVRDATLQVNREDHRLGPNGAGKTTLSHPREESAR